MPLTVGGRTPGPSDDQKIDLLAQCWADATLLAPQVQELEAKVARQIAWLDDPANRDHEKYGKRVMQYLVTKDELWRANGEVHKIASRANTITDGMSPALIAKAREHIHAWAGMKGAGICAMVWNIVPNPVWLQDAEEAGQYLRETVEVNF
jgi:hypothetical protein